MPKVPIGQANQKHFHRLLLASREHEALSDEEKATVAELMADPTLTKRDRWLIQQAWEPKGAAFGTHLNALRGVAVFELQQALHGSNDGDFDTGRAETKPGLRPQLVFEVFRSPTEIKVAVKQSASRFVALEGFNQHGDAVGDILVTVYINGTQTETTIAAATFVADDVAAFIDRALPIGDPA